MDLSFIRKYVERNPYTGGFTLDTSGLEADPALRELLGQAWEAGYWGGFDDGVGDCLAGEQTVNPYK